MKPAERLADLLESAGPRLESLCDDEAMGAVSGRWSKKQILGHLVDSASNNHQRIVRAQLAPSLEFPTYEQEGWVQAQAYDTASWRELSSLWLLFNRHLLHVIRNVPEDCLARPCSIGGREAIPLSEVIEGYVDHLEHHLSQILEAQ